MVPRRTLKCTLKSSQFYRPDPTLTPGIAARSWGASTGGYGLRRIVYDDVQNDQEGFELEAHALSSLTKETTWL